MSDLNRRDCVQRTVGQAAATAATLAACPALALTEDPRLGGTPRVAQWPANRPTGNAQKPRHPTSLGDPANRLGLDV